MVKIFKDRKLRKISLCIFFVIIALVMILVILVPSANINGKKPKSLAILSTPSKLVYFQGEDADYTGLTLLLTYNNGDTEVIDYTQCDISGFYSEDPVESRIIMVKYGDLSVLFSVEIKEFIKPSPILKNIYLSPLPKTEYKVGEWLNVDGAYIVREYLDGSTVTVNLLKTDVEGWQEAYDSGPGTYTLTVKYVENGVVAITTYDVTITE